MGYSYGYRNDCPELSPADITCPQLAHWLAELWPILPTPVREQIALLIETTLLEMSAPATESEAMAGWLLALEVSSHSRLSRL